MDIHLGRVRCHQKSLFSFMRSFLSFISFPFCEFRLCLINHIFFQGSTQHIFLILFQVVIQSSAFSCYAVLHTYESSPSFFPVHIPSCHTTFWVQTSVQCHYLCSFPVHVMKFLFCPMYNSATIPHHTGDSKICITLIIIKLNKALNFLR